MSEVIEGNHDEIRMNVNIYNIVNECTTLNVYKRGIKEVEVTQAVETTNVSNIKDIIISGSQFNKRYIGFPNMPLDK